MVDKSNDLVSGIRIPTSGILIQNTDIYASVGHTRKDTTSQEADLARIAIPVCPTQYVCLGGNGYHLFPYHQSQGSVPVSANLQVLLQGLDDVGTDQCGKGGKDDSRIGYLSCK